MSASANAEVGAQMLSGPMHYMLGHFSEHNLAEPDKLYWAPKSQGS